ncbi:putative epithelial splicing regulatory protein 2 [Scophthalmus maximus]|uniref:Putative epithelial splicing regulatory protein 2 n=1 Tax=Scophthalmus maximus TaxID=52904 RepID=A0A2U9BCX1_SCOMX|nr:putative epithelial splicing regulatory protein 2 [Scophthalmus maximus]
MRFLIQFIPSFVGSPCGQCGGEALVTFPSEEIARRAVAERSNHPFYGQQVHLLLCN